MKKKILKICCVFFILFVLGTSIKKGSAEDMSKESLCINDIKIEDVQRTALCFAENFTEKRDVISIKSTNVLLNNKNEICGYVVSFKSEKDDYGYIAIDFTKENPFSMFAIDEGQKDLKTEIADNKKIDTKKLEDEIYYFGGLIFGVVVDDNIYTSDGQIIKKPQERITYARTSYNGASSIFSSSYSGVKTGGCKTNKYCYYKSALSQSYIESVTGRYACAVLALTEVAYQEDILHHDAVANTFINLWSRTGTTVYKTENGIQYGETDISLIEPAMVQYAESKGKTVTTYVNSDVTYSLFAYMANRNWSGVMSYGINLTNGSVSNHCINVVGYVLTRVGSTSYNYIIVADGWHTGLKYINMTNTDFIYKEGIVFDIF